MVNGARFADNCFIPNPSKATSTIMFEPIPRTFTIVPTPNFKCFTLTPTLKALKSLPEVGFPIGLPTPPYVNPPLDFALPCALFAVELPYELPYELP